MLDRWRWKHGVPPILAWLAKTTDQLEAGEVPVWRIEALRDLVDEMRIQRASSRTASLHVMEMTEVFDETQAMLEKKFAKRYKTRVPIELVAYYISQPPSKLDRLPSTAAFIKENLADSPFRRVWLFDYFRKTIPLVYP